MPPKRKVDADDTATDVADTETVDLSKRLKDTHSMRTALVKGPMGSLTKAFADALEEATGLDIMLVKPNVETAMAYAIRPAVSHYRQNEVLVHDATMSIFSAFLGDPGAGKTKAQNYCIDALQLMCTLVRLHGDELGLSQAMILRCLDASKAISSDPTSSGILSMFAGCSSNPPKAGGFIDEMIGQQERWGAAGK